MTHVYLFSPIDPRTDERVSPIPEFLRSNYSVPRTTRRPHNPAAAPDFLESAPLI